MKGIDPKQMRKVGEEQKMQERMHQTKVGQMLLLRNLARKFNVEKLYFMPTQTNPLAIAGILQPEDPKDGISPNNSIPWTVLEQFIPLPAMEVAGRVGMFYEITYDQINPEQTVVTFTRRDIIDESLLVKEEVTSEEPAPAAEEVMGGLEVVPDPEEGTDD